ncbi:Histone H3 methyltransferase complex and RNA cleavage factor II complex, subunit SWD2 [Madurella fahalii]|uniref:Histone H3 methyltransferase complex and RNA cleavage factor II complex, subunit SWD2 n=1 Tax=Madurella fahalii TaxID=1157608 RepID=A0ABQ0GSU0_9PEZI
MASTPMDIDDASSAAATPSLNITRTLGTNVPSTTAVSDVISMFRPTKLFQRDDIKEGKPQPYVLSIDFDDPGELCMTSESDETIQIYNVKEGRHDKTLLSKKYGVKLAKFTHTSSSIIYASTKQNDAIRYLATHDNSFIRYFEGHEGAVTDLALHPGSDNFISCSVDNTARIWNIGTKQWTGRLFLNSPYLSAWDPSGNVFAVASLISGSILLYDYRSYEKGPFSVFDVLKARGPADPEAAFRGWTKLEFSNDGKHLLLGSRGDGHFLLDSFDGNLKAYLKKPGASTRRLGVGETEGGNVESSGECCFSPDGRYVLSGARSDLLVWDTMMTPGSDKVLDTAHVLEEKRETAVVAYNPRFNMIATADQELMFWLPDPHV